MHSKSGSGTRLTFHIDLTVNNIHHPFSQSQAQTVALGGVGGIALIELFKNVRGRLRADAAAGIRDLNNGVIPIRVELQPYQMSGGLLAPKDEGTNGLAVCDKVADDGAAQVAGSACCFNSVDSGVFFLKIC